MNTELDKIITVLPSQDIKRGIAWYKEYTGFEVLFEGEMYACLKREGLSIHLQGIQILKMTHY